MLTPAGPITIEAPSFRSALQMKLPALASKSTVPVRVSRLPLRVLAPPLKWIGPTVVPDGRSLVVVDPAAGKTRLSAAVGTPAGDQLFGSDQFELTLPTQLRVIALAER